MANLPRSACDRVSAGLLTARNKRFVVQPDFARQEACLFSVAHLSNHPKNFSFDIFGIHILSGVFDDPYVADSPVNPALCQVLDDNAVRERPETPAPYIGSECEQLRCTSKLISPVFLRGGRRILNDEDDDDGVFQLCEKANRTEDISGHTNSSLRSNLTAEDTNKMPRPEPSSIAQRSTSPLRRVRLTKSISTAAAFMEEVHVSEMSRQTPTERRPINSTEKGLPNTAITDGTADNSSFVETSRTTPVDLPHRVQTRSGSTQGSSTPPNRMRGLRESSIRSRKSPSRESSFPPRVSNDSKNTPPKDTHISYRKVRDIVLEHLRFYYESHSRLLKSGLKRERMRAAAPAKDVSRTTTSNSSPFQNMLSVDQKLIRGTRKLVHTTFNGSDTLSEHINQPFLCATSSVNAPPPYTSYIPLDKGVLVENERRLPSWPVFAGYEDPGEEYDHDVTKAYSQGIPDFWEYQTPRAHKAESLGPCIEGAFKQLGCSFTDALRCLLDRPKTWWFKLGSLEKDILKDWKKWTPTWERLKLDKVELGRTKVAWLSILAHLTASDPQQLATAGLLCAAVADICKVNIWDIAMHHKPYVKSMSESNARKVKVSPLVTELCRVCISHSCICHGEFLDDSDSESESSSTDQSAGSKLRKADMKARINVKQNVQVDMDRSDRLMVTDMFYFQDEQKSISESDYLGLRQGQSLPSGEFNHRFQEGQGNSIPNQQLCSRACFWKVSNRRVSPGTWNSEEITTLRQNLHSYASNSRGPCLLASVLLKPCVEVFHHMLEISSKLPREAALPDDCSSSSNDVTFEQDLKERSVHYPCSHEGPCNSTNCSCYENRVECEKTCHCDRSCRRRFPGCSCKRQGKICQGNPDCKCFASHRECDVDLCSSCGADEVLDPANRDRKDHDFLKDRCQNVNMQRALVKHTYIGDSTVKEAGYGLFMGELTKKNDYIGQYSGFILSKTEADRLGVIYHEQARVYLFVANTDLEVDALLGGSKIRFINHSRNYKTINCQAFLYLRNGTINIALYALREIAVGEELFFDYGYTKEQTQAFVEKSVREGSIIDGDAAKAFANVAVRPDRPTSKGSGDTGDRSSQMSGMNAATAAAILGLDDWPAPMKSDSEDEDYREDGENSKKHGQRSARKRARSSSPGSDSRRKRAKAK